MLEIEVLEAYLKGLYETYEALGADYKNLHKRSKKHNYESAENYYLRWKNKLLAEIRKIETRIVESGKCRVPRHCDNYTYPLPPLYQVERGMEGVSSTNEKWNARHCESAPSGRGNLKSNRDYSEAYFFIKWTS